MKVLVTGGAGYIGSHAVQQLREEGYTPIVFDNLSTGHLAAVLGDSFYKGDLLCPGEIDHCIERHRPEAVLHFASSCYVGESMQDPAKYYKNNIMGSLKLLDAMVQYGVRNIIFSSSCTVYGNTDAKLVTENLSRIPENTYGRTKKAVEDMLADYQRAYGLGSFILRYFNAAGADPEGRLGEDHNPETHLVPLVLKAALDEGSVKIFGTDYPTLDGTCVRDYIHVKDLARAHVKALEHLADGRESTAVNLGNGGGFSVRQVIDIVRQVTDRKIACREVERRAGDVPYMVAAIDKARRILNWEPEYKNLREIIETTWKWMLAHPNGYA